jgi:hypothetical protein
MSPEARAAYDESDAAARGAGALSLAVAQDKANASGDQIDKEASALETLNTKHALAEIVRQDEADKASKEILDEGTRYANMKVDPGHFWGSQNTGQKILITIAQAIANFGAGYTGHPERVNAELNHLIDRDIDAQKENIAHAGASLANKRGVYAEMLRRFGDQRAAEQAAKIAMIEKASLDTQALAARAGGPDAEVKAAEYMAFLKSQYAARVAQDMRRVEPKGGDSSKIAADLKWQAEHTEAPQQVVDTTAAAAQDLGTESGQTAAGVGFNYLGGVPLLGHLIYGDDVYSSDQKFKLAVAKGASELGRGNPAMTQYWVDLADKAHSPEARRGLLVNMQNMAQSQLRSVSGGVMPESNQAYQATKAINAPAAPQNAAPFTLKPPGSGSQ